MSDYMLNEDELSSRVVRLTFPAFLLALLAILCWTGRTQRVLKVVITEILTYVSIRLSLDSVDFLYCNMHFSFELSRL